jgi:hypothetical protein
MLRSKTPLVAAAAIALVVTACRSAQPRYPDAELVFTGTTIKTRAATIDATDVANLAIVRVDEILYSAPAFAELTASNITVRLNDPARAKEGERRLFYANGWQWSDGVAVQEVANQDVPSPAQLQTAHGRAGRCRTSDCGPQRGHSAHADRARSGMARCRHRGGSRAQGRQRATDHNHPLPGH